VRSSRSEHSVRPVEPKAAGSEPLRLGAAASSESPLATPRSTFHRLAFTASEAFVADLARVKDALATQFPEGDLASIFHAGLKLLLEKQAKREGQVAKPREPKPSRPPAASSAGPQSQIAGTNEDAAARRSSSAAPRSAIPARVKRAVWARDGHCCQWRLASGERCGAARFLQLDHIVPVARGGRSTLENLRVVCARHNLQAAREVFGTKWMSQFQRRARSDPAEALPRRINAARIFEPRPTAPEPPARGTTGSPQG
jgi:hypothetical protein